MRFVGIYQIHNLINNKIYIGSSTDVKQRLRWHKSKLRLNKHNNIHLQNAYNKYGDKNFIFKPIIVCNEDMLIWYEQRFIDQLKPEYNINPTAGRIKHLEETKNLLSKKLGEINRSEKRRKEVAKCNKNRIWEESSRMAIGNANHKRKVSETQRQKTREFNSKVWYNIISPDGVVYKKISNLKEFCRENNLDFTCMSRVLRHVAKYKTHRGWSSCDL